MSEPIKHGRPFVFTDAEELRLKVQSYFDEMDPHISKTIVENGYKSNGDLMLIERQVFTPQQHYTVSGLALHLGVDRNTLRNYRDPEHYNSTIPDEVRQELIRTIADAFQRVEQYAERKLFESGVANGAKFTLTNNFGWIDKSVVDTNLHNVDDVVADLDGADEVADRAAEELAKAEDAKPATQE